MQRLQRNVRDCTAEANLNGEAPRLRSDRLRPRDRFRTILLALFLILPFAVGGCGGGGGGTGNNPGPITVRVNVASATLVSGGSRQFTATVQNAATNNVTWTVEEGATGGTITVAGLYTAPIAPGVYHIVVKSQDDPTKSFTVTITVTAAVAIAVAPPTVTVAPGATQAFTATVQNSNDKAVTWSVQEGGAGGTITTAGLYKAPALAGTYHVVATSHADPTKTATATITVPVTISVQPVSPVVSVRRTQAFTATILGAANKTVQWSVAEAAGGTITAAGLYTAPNVAGTYHVTAKSVADPTKSATATVTVQSSTAIGTIQ